MKHPTTSSCLFLYGVMGEVCRKIFGNAVKNKPAVISLVEIYTSGDSRLEVQHHLQNSGNHYFHFTSVKNGWSQ